LKKKMRGIFVCLSMITTLVSVVGSPHDIAILKDIQHPHQYCTTENWTQQAKLLAFDGEAGDNFGCYVSLDKDTALIGAWLDNDYTGSAYVFIRNGTTWTQQAKLVASGGYTWDYFGYAVSISGDTGIVTAPQDDDNGADSGSAYVFTRKGTTWTQQEKLLASDGEEGDTFGWWAVCLNGDSALISSCRDDDNGLDSGSAYVFTRVSENQPPETPAAPTGPSSGNQGMDYTFSAVTTDPDEDAISYFFDWGDGENSDWIGPVPSGTPTNTTHAWSEKGTYLVKVKAKDESGAETDWSAIHPISIASAPHLLIEKFKGGIGVRAVVKNIGDDPLTNIVWSIDLQGKHVTGKISSLTPWADTKIKTGLILGFGRTNIVATAYCDEGATYTKNATAFLLIFFVVGISESIL
jgi:hypothetical protein